MNACFLFFLQLFSCRQVFVQFWSKSFWRAINSATRFQSFCFFDKTYVFQYLHSISSWPNQIIGNGLSFLLEWRWDGRNKVFVVYNSSFITKCVWSRTAQVTRNNYFQNNFIDDYIWLLVSQLKCNLFEYFDFQVQVIVNHSCKSVSF